jgi:hypothetical protein
MFWLFQEWFIYQTLLGEPLILNLLELSILLLGSLVEGAIIAFFLSTERGAEIGMIFSHIPKQSLSRVQPNPDHSA